VVGREVRRRRADDVNFSLSLKEREGERKREKELFLTQTLFFWWDWNLNSELCAWITGTLTLEPLSQSILVSLS
jgi:hypothetical protein